MHLHHLNHPFSAAADSEIQTDYCEVNRSYGFGYVSSTNEYKVVGVYGSRKTLISEIHIYTLGSGNGWRNLGKFNLEFGIFPWIQAVFANEALYWNNWNLKMIVTFDLAEEKFCEHLSPPPLPEYNVLDYNRLGVLDGFLYYGISQDVEEVECFDTWLLKEKNDNQCMKERETHQSLVWRKEFRVDKSKLLAVTKSGGVLTYVGKYLYIYDTKTSTSKMVVDLKEELVYGILPHKNTLVSLKELGEEDSKTSRS